MPGTCVGALRTTHAGIIEKFHAAARQNRVNKLQLLDIKHFTWLARNLTPSSHRATTTLNAKRRYTRRSVRFALSAHIIWFRRTNLNNRKTYNHETWHTFRWESSASDRVILHGTDVPVHATNSQRLVEVKLHWFLTSALSGGKWSASRPGQFTPGVERTPVPIG
jgi:hypothetical protein